jgi:diphosphomevalonate decarboxylase
MKSTARAYANIALIKYWGNLNEELRLPLNNTISFNLDKMHTTTTVDFSPVYKEDAVFINEQEVNGPKKDRVIQHIDRFRNLAAKDYKVKMVSRNSFPTGAGIASSASAFAALSLACSSALSLNLNEKELSSIARLGSGSAARSIPGGFVEWLASDKHEGSYAHQIASPDHMDICDIIAIVSEKEKKTGSTDGHKLAPTSLYHNARIEHIFKEVNTVRKAILEKDLDTMGPIIENDALALHFIAMTSNPHLFYWEPLTLDLMKAIQNWRKSGVKAYFTIDAGPNVHIITTSEYATEIERRLKDFHGVIEISRNRPAGPAHLLSEDLF